MKALKNGVDLLKREFKLFLANSTLRSVFFLAPIIYAVLLAAVYQSGKVTEISVIVVDRDNTPASEQLIEMMNDNEGINVTQELGELTDVKRLLFSRKAAAVVVIPDRFEADILQTKYPEVQIFLNTTNILTANFASKAIQQSLGAYAVGAEVKALQRRGMTYSQAMTKYEPFKQNYQRVFNETGNYFTFMWPAMLAVILQQVILLAMAVSFASEIEKGTFRTVLMAETRSGITAVLVKVIPVWVFSVLIVGIYYFFHWLFRAPMPVHALNYVVISGFFVVAATFLGTAFSMLIPNALKATQILMVIASPSFIIGGYTWPQEAMPWGVQALANSVPLSPFLDAFKKLLIQGANLSDCMPEIKIMGIQILVFGILSVILINLRMRKESKKASKIALDQTTND